MAAACVIELNDTAITLADAGGIRHQSPACIVCSGRRMLIGQAARECMRINPPASHDRFWAWLDQSPLPRAMGQARSRADLAYIHLQDLWQPVADDYDRVLLAIPAGFDRDALAVALGIMRALEIPVTGMASSALAMAVAGAGEDCLVLDAQLHRMSAERIERDGDELVLADSSILVERGFNALETAWAQMIAGEFLAQTRFDPLDSARSEQELYNALPGWLADLEQRGRIALTLSAGVRSYRIELPRERFMEAADVHYQPLLDAADSANGTLIATDRLARLPGLVAALKERRGDQVRCLATADGLKALLDRQAAFEAEDDHAAVFVTRLPVGSEAARAPADPPTAPPQPVGPPPTHLLAGDRAWPLDARGWCLDDQLKRAGAEPAGEVEIRADKDRGVQLTVNGSDQVELNDQPFSGTHTLALGDRVRVGGNEFRLIRIEDDEIA